MTECELVRALLDRLENGSIVSVFEFARTHADRLGIPLPDSWMPTAQRDEAKKAARAGGWRGVSR